MRYPILRFWYRFLLRLLPQHLRQTHAEEMERLFTETLHRERERHGVLGVLFVVWGAMRDVLGWAHVERRTSAPLPNQPGRMTPLMWLGGAGLVQDLGYAIRSLRKSPGFSVTAVLTLALGIGGSVAIFSVVDFVLLRPLPFPESSQLYTVWENHPETGRTQSRVAPPTFFDWRRLNDSFTDMSVVSSGAKTLSNGAAPERVSATSVTPSFFELLGVQMHAGGTFPPEAEAGGDDKQVILSFGFWRQWFGADAGVVGQSLILDDEPHLVRGVLPESFWFPEMGDLWLPLSFTPDQLSEGMRGARYLEVVARLRDDVSRDIARQEMDGIAVSLGETHPNSAGWGVTLIGLHENMIVEYRRSLALLMFATVLVLVIASVNVVNLVLVRASEQKRERAVRIALGASGIHIFWHSMLQNVILAVSGGLLGALLASWALPPLAFLAPSEIPRMESVSVHLRVLLIAVLMSLTVGVLLSAVSTWSGAGSDPCLTIRSAQVGGAPARHRVRRLLIVTEICLSLILLIGAGLLIRSFVRLQRVDPGFATSDVTSVSFSLPLNRYGSDGLKAVFYSELLERFAGHPEVTSVAATTNVPLSGSAMSFGFAIDGRPEASLGEQLSAEYHAVTPGYFRTMDISLRSGRDFGLSDDASGPPALIINETMARQFWPGEDPLGQMVTVVSQTGPISREIVGVVSDVRHAGLAAQPRVEVYVPLAQDPWSFVNLVVRASEGVQVSQIVRSELAAVDPALPIGSVTPIGQLVDRWLAPLRFQMVLICLFAVSALLLAAIGLYGVVSYMVSWRANELGVRVALGATAHHLFSNVVGQGAWLAAAGAALGVVVSLLVSRQLSGLLYEVSAIDPLVFVSVPCLVVMVAVTACLLPARKALRVDPMRALRDT